MRYIRIAGLMLATFVAMCGGIVLAMGWDKVRVYLASDDALDTLALILAIWAAAFFMCLLKAYPAHPKLPPGPQPGTWEDDYTKRNEE